MPLRRKLTMSLAAAAVGVAALAGVAGCSVSGTANADPATEQSSSSSATPPADMQNDVSELAALLADKLGVDESKASTAITDFLEANKPTGAPSGDASAPSGGQPTSGSQPSSGSAPTGTPPSDGSGGQPPAGGGGWLSDESMRSELAANLADKLSVDEAKVTTIIEDYADSASASASAAAPSSTPTS